MYKTIADFDQNFASQGVVKDKSVILYCRIGVLKGKGFDALVDILGYPNVKIDDGGYNKWDA